MTLSDNQLLPFLIIFPVFAAAFVSRIPHFDISSVRQIVTAILSIWLILLLKCSYTLFQQAKPFSLSFDIHFSSIHYSIALSFGYLQFILLLGLWCALFSLFFLNKHSIEKTNSYFATMVLLSMALSTAAILSSVASTSIIIADLNLLLFLYLIAFFGGAKKGSAISMSGVFFLAIDISAMAILLLPPATWQSYQAYLYLLALLPALARLLIPFFAPFYRTLFYDCPTVMITLYVSFIIPTGAALLFQIKATLLQQQVVFVFNPFIYILILISMLLSVLWSMQEKDVRQIGLSLLVFYNTIFISIVLNPNLNHLSNLAASLLFSAIICASFTLFIGQLLYLKQDQDHKNINIHRLWLASLVLWFPLPGIGMGTALYLSCIYPAPYSILNPTLYMIFWLIIFLLLTVALIQNYFGQGEMFKTLHTITEWQSHPLESFKGAWLFFVLILFLCLLSSTYFLNTGV